MTKKSLREMGPVLAGVDRVEKAKALAWQAARLRLMPAAWAGYIKKDFERRGGLPIAAACAWLLGVTEQGQGRVPLSASDDDLRAAAKEAALEGAAICAAAAGAAFRFVSVSDVPVRDREGRGRLASVWGPGVSVPTVAGRADVAAVGGFGKGAALQMLNDLCGRWWIEPAPVAFAGDVDPAVKRMCCARWWLRRLRRAHGRRGEGAAIVGGVVRRGLWPYASQDAVERRQAQRRRNAASMARASLENVDTGEYLSLADVVAGSVANPAIKRGELMARVRGADEYAEGKGWACEFWTVTAPSRFHAQRITGAVSDANPSFDGSTPRDAARYLSGVWARARAAWKRRGLQVAGLRTAEPHHDGCPHWHLIAYGPARDLRFARRLLRVYALRDSGQEPGARKHRFAYLKAKGGTMGAAYAAKYISKNIDGGGMVGDIDQESGRKVSGSVLRVDAWAAHWGIRQFQFFGMPAVGLWRALRKLSGPFAVVGSVLERARAAADAGDFRAFWVACAAGSLSLIRRDDGRLTQYGDKAAAVVAGVMEDGRRALLPVRNWLIHWGGKPKKEAGGVAFDLPRSRVINCTGGDFDDGLAGAVAALGF